MPTPLRDCESHEQLDLEERRENLRDHRWHRWRDMIVTFVVSIGVMTGAVPLERVMDAMLKAAGIP